MHSTTQPTSAPWILHSSSVLLTECIRCPLKLPLISFRISSSRLLSFSFSPPLDFFFLSQKLLPPASFAACFFLFLLRKSASCSTKNPGPQNQPASLSSLSLQSHPLPSKDNIFLLPFFLPRPLSLYPPVPSVFFSKSLLAVLSPASNLAPLPTRCIPSNLAAPHQPHSPGDQKKKNHKNPSLSRGLHKHNLCLQNSTSNKIY